MRDREECAALLVCVLGGMPTLPLPLPAAPIPIPFITLYRGDRHRAPIRQQITEDLRRGERPIHACEGNGLHLSSQLSCCDELTLTGRVCEVMPKL